MRKIAIVLHYTNMKSGQVRMIETIAVLFVFFILLVIGLVFYVQIQRDVFIDKRATINAEQSISVALRALFLPELRCSKGDNIPVKDCVDVYKLPIAQRVMTENSDYYFDLFRFATIRVEQIYPVQNSWLLYNETRNGTTQRISTPIPISLYDPLSRDFGYGVLTIETYT